MHILKKIKTHLLLIDEFRRVLASKTRETDKSTRGWTLLTGVNWKSNCLLRPGTQRNRDAKFHQEVKTTWEAQIKGTQCKIKFNAFLPCIDVRLAAPPLLPRPWRVSPRITSMFSCSNISVNALFVMSSSPRASFLYSTKGTLILKVLNIWRSLSGKGDLSEVVLSPLRFPLVATGHGNVSLTLGWWYKHTK